MFGRNRTSGRPWSSPLTINGLWRAPPPSACASQQGASGRIAREPDGAAICLPRIQRQPLCRPTRSRAAHSVEARRRWPSGSGGPQGRAAHAHGRVPSVAGAGPQQQERSVPREVPRVRASSSRWSRESVEQLRPESGKSEGGWGLDQTSGPIRPHRACDGGATLVNGSGHEEAGLMADRSICHPKVAEELLAERLCAPLHTQLPACE